MIRARSAHRAPKLSVPLRVLLAWSLAWCCIAGVCAQVPLSDFARHQRHGDVKISPDGSYIATTAMEGDRGVLSLIRLSDMKGFNLRPHDRADAVDFWWISDHTVVYSVGEKLGGLQAPLLTGELYTINADGSGQRQIAGVRHPGRFQGFTEVLDELPGAEPQLLVRATPWSRCEDGPYPTARAMNSSGAMKILATAPICRASFIADNTGVVRFAFADDVDQRMKVYYRASAGRDWELVFDQARDGHRIIPLQFDRGDAAVYVICPGVSGVGGICRWHIATRALQTLWSGSESAPTELFLTADNSEAFAVESMPGRISVSMLSDTAPEAILLERVMQQFPGQRVRLGTQTRDGRKRVVRIESDVNPGEFYLLDLDSKQMTFLLARRPWIKPELMATMQPIVLKARDDQALHGYITRPPGKSDAAHLPLVVFVHGGPYGVRDRWTFDADVQALASRGYAVLQVNFRGSEGYGDAFADAGHRQWGAKMQEDVTDATRWAIAQGYVDPERICIFGGSYGGYAALEGAIQEPDLYRCAIGYVGIYDLRMMYTRGEIPESQFGRGYLNMAIGEDRQELIDRSPISHLERLKAGLMLIVGGADIRVPEEQGKQLHGALRSRGIAHEWLYERSEGHGFYNEAHIATMYAKIIDFLDRQIGHARNGTPAS